LARPDVAVTLLEPLLRRVRFLDEARESLGLGERVRVVRGRAEEPAVRRALGESDWVTARAVAPLDRLVRWCLPLVRPGGCLLAVKGESVRDEVDRYERSLRAAGVASTDIRQVGVGSAGPTWVAVIRRSAGGSTGRRGTA
jgi:16S rRNA (guanine527-N7)-methyltransferase